MPGATRTRPISVSGSILLLGLLGVPAYAQVHFDVSAQPLAKALATLGTQAGLNIYYDPSDVQGLQAPALKAELSAGDALERLLAGTKLKAVYVDENTVRVMEDTPPPADATSSKATSILYAPTSTRLALVAPDQGTGASTARVPVASGGPDSPGSGAREQVSGARPPVLEEIVVTGSHVRGVQNATVPATVFSSADIDRTGYSTPQEFFRSLPQNFSGGGVTQDGQFGGGVNSNRNYTAATSLNLRGLGPSSTLLLLNGHRIAPTVFGSAVDLSLIPLAAVDRIEMVTDGSSALYGSDAVAGVVNVLMKPGFEGAETRALYGSATRDGRQQIGASQLLGDSWGSGNALLTLQYQDHDPLTTGNRSLRGSLPADVDLLPAERTSGGLLTVRQELSQQLELTTDALISRRKLRRDFANTLGDRTDTHADSDSDNVNVGLAYKPGSNLAVTLSGQYSRANSEQSQVLRRATGQVQPATTNQKYDIRGVSLLVSGSVVAVPAGTVGVAIGSEYRNERQSSVQTQSGVQFSQTAQNQDIRAAFAEVYVPIVSDANRLPGVRALDLSGSVRYDDYSEFGSTTNYRVGTRWSPAAPLDFRASYSTSFRAPNTLELAGAAALPGILITRFVSPTGAGTVPGFQLFGGGKPLDPETARSWSIGADYTPPQLPALRLSLSYYDIRYSDRIITPPATSTPLQQANMLGPLIETLGSDAEAQALIDSIRAQGGNVFDFVGTGAGGVRFAYDGRQVNASTTHQSGLDASIAYAHELGFGRLDVRATGTHIRQIDTALTSTAPSADLLDTYGNPVAWRGRLDVGLQSRAVFANIAVNYTDAYRNTISLSGGPISSWTTLDTMVRIEPEHWFAQSALNGTSASLSVVNLFDHQPPLVNNTGSLIGVAYDPANASPLGRFVSFEVRKRW